MLLMYIFGEPRTRLKIKFDFFSEKFLIMDSLNLQINKYIFLPVGFVITLITLLTCQLSIKAPDI